MSKTLIDLEEWRKRSQKRRQDHQADAPKADAGRATTDSNDSNDSGLPERIRLRQNIAAGIAVILLILIALWLFGTMRDLDRMLNCIQQGRTNCNPIGR